MTENEINDYFTRQLSHWPDARKRYEALSSVCCREVSVGNYVFTLQHNPARAISTCANLDAASIAARPCFLCKSNRPDEQESLPMLDGRYELLVNPFPIFSPHFVIASAEHTPQVLEERCEDMVKLASSLRGLVVFFNAAQAGASAPDHFHFQAVRQKELALLNTLETSGISEIPFCLYHSKSASSEDATEALTRDLKQCGSRINAFVWQSESGVLHTAVIPRIKHRPSCFNDGRMISPASIDLAGTLILPRHDDYETLTADELSQILTEICFKPLT